MMFTKFGEMNSCKEINELAENLFKEGDIKSLKEMAAENGIPEDMVDMYLQGGIPQSARQWMRHWERLTSRSEN